MRFPALVSFPVIIGDFHFFKNMLNFIEIDQTEIRFLFILSMRYALG